jgi:hypothetical protein
MSKIEIYQNNKLIGDYESDRQINGIIYYVVVCPINPSSELDVLFREMTAISRFAINKKYDRFDDDVALPDLENMTFSKARARIATEQYEKGNDYIQDITVDSLDALIKPVDDDIIQRTILIGLRNIRKKHPRDYETQYLDPQGICFLLGIDMESFLYNVGLLEEDGLIGVGPTKEFYPENGGIYIKSYGINYLVETNEHKQSQEKVTLYGDLGESYSTEYKYDIALSFAGEDREVAESLANSLKYNKIRVFYDDFEQSELWGKNLYEHLSKVYNESARFCIMIISKHYASKTWTTLERQNAQARAFREQQEYLLPIRLDDTKIPGLLETVGYINFNDHSIEEITNLIIRKLKTK